jgi:hypothetical protein
MGRGVLQCIRVLCVHTWLDHTFTGFIRGILREVRYAKSLRVLFSHRRSPSWTTLVLYSRVVFFFNEPTNGCLLVQHYITYESHNRGRVLGRNWDKSLQSFSLCYSQSPLLTDFTPPPPSPFEQKWLKLVGNENIV